MSWGKPVPVRLGLRVLLAFLIGCGCAPAWAQSNFTATTHSPHGPLKVSCAKCHNFNGWLPIRAVPEFDHSKARFPLQGMHTKVLCQDCHLQPVFHDVGNKCADCHADIHRRKNGAQCEACHTVNGWQVSIHSINLHQDRFPLIGAHAAVDCASCHKGGALASTNRLGLPTDCASCHLNSFMKATAPNHQALKFSTDCRQCHMTLDSWMGAASPNAARR